MIPQELRIDPRRMRDTFEQMARIGGTPAGGVTRLALSVEDRQARDLFVSWCRAAGYALTVDDLGNVYARRSGTAADLAPVVAGSHLDSVAHGGRFDGVLGVLAALEVARTLDDNAVRTRHPLVLVDFSNEEGARFEPAMMGSGALAGRFESERVLGTRDPAGQTFGDELAAIGYAGDISSRLRDAAAYFELHIEQGPVLEAAGIRVGVVTGIQGSRWSEASFTGVQCHAGATPMGMRHDAAIAAFRLALDARELARARPGAMATVGRARLEPGIINVVTGIAVIGLDLRHPDAAGLAELGGAVEAAARGIAAEEGVELRHETFWDSPPTEFDVALVDSVERAAARLGVATMRLQSGPGHDAKYMAEIAPAAMVFVRTRGGRSHCEDEDAGWEDCELAANVLLHAVLEAAG